MGEPQELGALPGSDTERVPLPLIEHPASCVALPAWPILHQLRGNGPPLARTTSPVSLSKDDSTLPGPFTREALRPSPWGRVAAVRQGVPSPDLAAVLLLQPQPRTHVRRTRRRVSLLTHVRSGPGFYWPVRHPDQSELALPEGLSLHVSPR